MNKNYFVMIAGIALLCLLLIFVSLWQEIDKPVTKEPILPPNIGPYNSQISGIGIVEPSSNNIFIGTPLNRLVEHVFVKVGENVEKGEALFSLENRDLRANLNVQKAAYESAIAKLERLKQLPQPQDLVVAEMNLNSAKIALESARSQNEMVTKLPDLRAISQEERNRRLFAFREAEAQLNQAKANFDKVKAGIWKPDLEIAQQEVAQAKASVDLVNTEIERTVIRSPIDGTVLQVGIRDGEMASMDKTPLMVIGNIDEMYLRVSINQLDIPKFHLDAPAVAFPQGSSKTKYYLVFVRLEPFLTRKSNLTNDIYEKVDTRVLQIVYRIKNEDNQLFVGQQMDVFIETDRPQEK
jgi:HlyD family secretion protein